ncbi:L,D-transpeptidase [Paenibacillus sp. sgz500958]|uniref:L,D-transpeptidase family protein n=1 Tax=Paenibacillus sp. sgz500958 TaxID=3242475 RepID=UPI0036D33A06
MAVCQHKRIAAVLLFITILFVICMTLQLKQVSASAFSAAWPYKAEILKSRQVIVVEATSTRSQTGTLSLREIRNGQWRSVISRIPVALGREGIAKIREGDGRTPSGVYLLVQAFGSAVKPVDLKLTFTQTSYFDYWIDDPASAEYNQWVTYTGNPAGRWNSYEHLLHPLYKYAVVIRYNEAPVVPGKGSAIFLHIWRTAAKPTAGCIAMSEANLLKLIKLLDPALTPAIAIGLGDVD